MAGVRQEVIDLAMKAHDAHWRMSGDAGTGDRLALRVTRSWQQDVAALDPERFQIEYQISPGLGERIDIVDVRDGGAYELKVSPNNAHFEFYRDIFKVLIARDRRLPGLRSLAFLVPRSAAEKLMRTMAAEVVAKGPALGLALEVVPI